MGEVVAEDYGRAMVFKRYGIDFCCGGGRSVASACKRAGVSYAELALALDEVETREGGSGSEGLRKMELDVLAVHIVDRHHAYARESLPTLLQFAEKVARVHGPRHPELAEVFGGVEELAGEMTRHMDEEEEVLFPRIRDLARHLREGATPTSEDRSGIQDILPSLESDHERAGGLMARIRDLTSGFSPPPDACNTYRALFVNLERFEEDLHRHVHLENNVLFPRALALAGDLPAL